MKRYLLAVLLLPLCVTCRSEALHAPTPAIARLIEENIGVLDSTVLVMQFPAPPIYTMWRAEVERCSGLSRPGVVTYWVAQRVALNEKGALGMYVSTDRRILLGLGNESVSWIVRHENLHDLLNLPKGVDAHPSEYYRTKCGALVYPPGMYPS